MSWPVSAMGFDVFERSYYFNSMITAEFSLLYSNKEKKFKQTVVLFSWHQLENNALFIQLLIFSVLLVYCNIILLSFLFVPSDVAVIEP